MSKKNTNIYMRKLKLHIFKALKDHPFILAPIITAVLGLILSTAFFQVYPEVIPDALNLYQILLINLVLTSVLSSTLLYPGLLCFDLQNTRLKRLSNKIRFKWALFEFYLPNLCVISFLLTYLYDFTKVHQAIIGLLLSFIALCSFILSWPFRRRVSGKKLSFSKNKLTKMEVLNRIGEGVLLPLLGTLVFIFILGSILSLTRIINIYAFGIENYIKLIGASGILLIPSFLIYALKNTKGIILGFLSAGLILTLIIPKNLSPTYQWLVNHDISNYEGYDFFIKQQTCEALKFNNVRIQKLTNGDCKILTPFTIISSIGKWYKISLQTRNINEQIEFINKKDILLMEKNSSQLIASEDLDKKTEIFAKMFNKSILVALKDVKNPIMFSSHGISRKHKFEISMGNNKALSLGSLLHFVNNLIKLEDSASLIDKKYSGTILEALLKDKKNQFFNLLTARLSHSYRHGFAITTIDEVINLFRGIVQENVYLSDFSKLGFWKVTDFDKEQVIELLCKKSGMELLLLYFTQQKLTIAIALKNPDFIFSIKDKRIQNFLHTVIKRSKD
ncbi:MAG: hypothetical protein H0U70_02540 [Tatlockia sp.]|nr:hypothetical protein [Tatlockia sp.]